MAKVYYIGPQREYKSITELFLKLSEDKSEKTIYIDEGVYDIFKEYKEAAIPSPADDVSVSDYFTYNAFLPLNTKLIGLGKVRLEFLPDADDITYGESITWAPLNIRGACNVENIEIHCKNGRYCIHDDGHNKITNVEHCYKNVVCVYHLGDLKGSKRLGLSNTIGFGFAQGCNFTFEDCTFCFEGQGNYSAFYGHDDGAENPENMPTILIKNCNIHAHKDSDCTLRLQSLAVPGPNCVKTLVESCDIKGGIYLTIYHENNNQKFDVTLVDSGIPPIKSDYEKENMFPVKVYV